MGNKAYSLIKEGKTVLFAFEEAIGFMNGSEVGVLHIIGKDPISKSLLLFDRLP